MRSLRANTALEQRSLFRVSRMSLESTFGAAQHLLCSCDNRGLSKPPLLLEKGQELLQVMVVR
jgi:hypothetical protein